MDSLRRYDPDQVLRDSLSHCRLWQWHPGRERNLMSDSPSLASVAGVIFSDWGQRGHFDHSDPSTKSVR